MLKVESNLCNHALYCTFWSEMLISRRTLAAIEADKANPTLNTINQLFGIFGLKIALTSKYPGH